MQNMQHEFEFDVNKTLPRYSREHQGWWLEKSNRYLTNVDIYVSAVPTSVGLKIAIQTPRLTPGALFLGPMGPCLPLGC
jgi:hypothetical protein